MKNTLVVVIGVKGKRPLMDIENPKTIRWCIGSHDPLCDFIKIFNAVNPYMF